MIIERFQGCPERRLGPLSPRLRGLRPVGKIVVVAFGSFCVKNFFWPGPWVSSLARCFRCLEWLVL